MEPTNTIDVAELATAQLHLGAVPPPILVSPGAPSAKPGRLHVIGKPEVQASLHATNGQPVSIAPVECRFVCDITVQGSGYVLHGDRIVTDGSHLSDVTREWVDLPMPDSPKVVKQPVERFVDGLAVVAIAPGHLIYGHWLVDFIPRFVAAKDALGPAFAEAKLVLPHDTPGWALAMIEAFTGATAAQCVFYQRGVERLALPRALIPSYVHTNFAFNPYAETVFARLATLPERPGTRRLCISRVAFEGATHGSQKLFHTRLGFEKEAERRGYQVVRPELLGLRQQAELFASASHVVGEYGSALHSAVFAPPGLRMGYIRCPNAIQLRIAALRRQSSVIVVPDEIRIKPDTSVEYTLTGTEMSALFDANEV